MKFLHTAAATTLSAIMAFSFTSQANALDDAQKKEMGEFIRQYLVEHPEIMVEVQRALEKKQAEARQEQASAAVSENQDALFRASYDLALGNPDGKITIVEFFDYNCSYCKHAIADMDAIIKANPEVRFVLKEFPILGEDSQAAHKISDAFRKLAPAKYGEFHRELLGGEGRANEARALEIAISLGVTEQNLRDEMAKSGNDQSVRDTYELATKLGITGTPSYVLGNEAIFGAVGAETIGSKISNISQCGKTVC